MSNKKLLKKMYEEKINKNNNYNKIIERINNKTTYFNYKYVLIPLSIIIIFVVIFNNYKSLKNNIIINEENNINININKYNERNKDILNLDIDVKIIECDNYDNFTFIEELNIPNDLNKDKLLAYYVKDDNDEYTRLNNYTLLYKFNDNINFINKNITISFSSEYIPLRDYIISSNEEKSYINNTELTITQFNNTYIVIFSYNNINFDIETNGITQNELIDLLLSIIKE